MKRYLKKIVLVNFQGYDKLVLRLGPGVNSIVGKSDSGKTTITRAVKMVATNKPLGAKYYCNYAPAKGTMSVKLVFSDKVSVKLERRVSKKLVKGKWKKTVIAGSQKYTINIDGKKRVLSGFKNIVPTDVLEALDMNDLNIQGQFDPAFLVDEGGTKIAKFINEITEADNVDEWQSKANTFHTRSVSASKAAQTEIDEVTTKLKRLSNLDALEKKIVLYEKWVDRSDRIEGEIEKLTELVHQLETLDEELNVITPVVYELDKLCTGLEKVDLREEQKLRRAIQNLKDYIDIETQCKKAHEKFEKVDARYKRLLAKLGRCPFCGATTKRKK